MNKTVITFLAAGLLTGSGLKAQTVQEGMNHLYADRFKSAIAVFEKLLATNPNNIEATYWLGQTYFDMDDNAKARQVYDNASAANGNAPLLLVGLGHADLHDNKPNDARQKFEAAITAATNNKKVTDPIVLTAIGRANVDAKAGDPVYAVQKLELADKGGKSTETLLQLGNAYRKATPGQGGGQAFETYKRALQLNPAFAAANLRLSKLFESQKNWELVIEYLNAAIKSDSKFAPAYYELFYYNFFRAKFPEAEEQLTKYIANSDAEPQHEYLFAQLCWARKDFPCAVSKAESVVTAMGVKTKPKVYKLLADANFQKGDYTAAKTYMDKYFGKEKPEDLIANDYKLLADILAKTGGTNDEVYNAYVKGAAVDTVLTSKIEFLKQGAKVFKDLKIRDKEGDILQIIIDLKPKPTINDYFDLTLARYFSFDYTRSRAISAVMIEKFPELPYGYEWKFNSSNAVDTIKKDSIAVPDALELYAFAQKDTAKYKKQYLSAVKFLGAYYINQAKDKAKSLEFFTKWLEADPSNAVTIQGYIEQIKRMPARPATNSPNGNAKPKKPSAKPVTAKSKTTVIQKGTVVKK
jgi:tetratricopeptide (TPR) repeat protein